MEINEINKKLYESQFIENGEYGYHGGGWAPSIDEREIENWCGDDEGNYVPATPLGYRDYKESRLAGLAAILAQVPAVDLCEDRLHSLKRGEGKVKQYDKIITDKGDFVVIGDDEDNFYVVDATGRMFSVRWSKDESGD